MTQKFIYKFYQYKNKDKMSVGPYCTAIVVN